MNWQIYIYIKKPERQEDLGNDPIRQKQFSTGEKGAKPTFVGKLDIKENSCE